MKYELEYLSFLISLNSFKRTELLLSNYIFELKLWQIMSIKLNANPLINHIIIWPSYLGYKLLQQEIQPKIKLNLGII